MEEKEDNNISIHEPELNDGTWAEKLAEEAIEYGKFKEKNNK